MNRTKDRLRLQNSLLDEAISMLQKELAAIREKPSYPSVLTGLALRASEKLPSGTAVKIQLAQEDESLGEDLAARLAGMRPELVVSLTMTLRRFSGESGSRHRMGRGGPRPTGGIAYLMKDPLAERILNTVRTKR